MDATPFWEDAIRLATTAAALFATAALYTLWRIQAIEKHPARYLTLFMLSLVLAVAIDRIFILWIGIEDSGRFDEYVEIIRAVGASLLGLVLLGIGLTACFFIKHRRFDLLGGGPWK